MVPGVADLWRSPQDAPASNLATPEQLRQQLMGVRNTHAIIVLMVDILDASGSFLNRVRDLVGKNPVVVIGTKADLLPRGTDMEAVADWLRDAALHKRLNAFAVCLVSSRTGEGVQAAANVILRERRGRDVYILGAANVGKSAFIRALMREMSSVTSTNFDPVAASSARRLPVESAMPGTTLRIIPLKAFSSSSALYDTPGVHYHHRLIHMLSPSEMKALHPLRKLRPYVAPTPRELCDRAGLNPDLGGNPAGHCSGTYFWGALARIDVLESPPATQLVFYGPAALRVTCEPLRHDTGSEPSSLGDPLRMPQPPPPTVAATPLRPAEAQLGSATASPSSSSADEGGPVLHVMHREDSLVGSGHQQAEAGSRLGHASVGARGGLVLAKRVNISAAGLTGPLADIAISGLSGWVTVSAPLQRGRITMRIWLPRGVEAYVRPPLPVSLHPG